MVQIQLPCPPIELTPVDGRVMKLCCLLVVSYTQTLLAELVMKYLPSVNQVLKVPEKAAPMVEFPLAVAIVSMTFWPAAPLWNGPVAALEPLRIANQYGLFAVMTPHRYEIEFQGSKDGVNWVPYLFRYKPQDVGERPGIYAPYQPRFDWNLWFASLTNWQQSPIVPITEERLLEGDKDVLGLFRGDAFAGHPPKLVRAVLWQYWFSTPEQKRASGVWWTREMRGTYAPTLERLADGQFRQVESPTLDGPP